MKEIRGANEGGDARTSEGQVASANCGARSEEG